MPKITSAAELMLAITILEHHKDLLETELDRYFSRSAERTPPIDRWKGAMRDVVALPGEGFNLLCATFASATGYLARATIGSVNNLLARPYRSERGVRTSAANRPKLPRT